MPDLPDTVNQTQNGGFPNIDPLTPIQIPPDHLKQHAV